ncbi:hypothetical protein N7530_010665 [Penicillium desertorum]|uniref:Uncharacterized protein n=1 Tax=Penicillium desertorum TaxID=1303715 RepID=A0A9W9WHV1_9EURO|nr:hypothetical protein N7530_010665 [Penicillium desertorum]
MAESEASGAGTEFTDVRPEGPEALDALPDDDKGDIGGDSGDHDNGNDDGSGCGATPYGVTLIRLAYEPLSHTCYNGSFSTLPIRLFQIDGMRYMCARMSLFGNAWPHDDKQDSANLASPVNVKLGRCQ